MGAVMLAVDRDQASAGAPGRLHDQFAARDQNLFIRQAELLAQVDRLVGGFEARDADDGRHHEIDFRGRRSGDQSPRTGHQFRPAFPLETGRLEPPAQLRKGLPGRNDGDARPKFLDLLGQDLGIRAGGQGVDAVALPLAADHIERATTDRARRAEDGDGLHAVALSNGCTRPRQRNGSGLRVSTTPARASRPSRPMIPSCPPAKRSQIVPLLVRRSLTGVAIRPLRAKEA